MNDTEIVQRCARLDPWAWRGLVMENLDVIHRAVSRVLGKSARSEAEDVVQAVFLKLLEDDCRRLRTFEGRCRLSTWLVTVARREALDFLQRRKRTPAVPISRSLDRLVTDLKDDPAVVAEASQLSEGIQAALERLPTRDHLLLRMIYLDGATYGQVSRILAVPANSISPWLGRAKDRLKKLLKNHQTAN